MRGPFPITIELPTEAATTAFAERLAPRLGPGDTLLLSGPIGAGKTHFARALIKARLRAAGRDEDVPSPTFTLVQTYDDDLCEIWHADLYRLTGPAEAAELGLEEAFASSIALVEWPDRLGGQAPAGALHLDLAAGSDDAARRLTFSSGEPRWAGRLADVLPRSAHA